MSRRRDDSRDRNRKDRSSRDRKRDGDTRKESKGDRDRNRPKQTSQSRKERGASAKPITIEKYEARTETGPAFQVYVSGFGPLTTKQELEEVFDRYGEVKAVHVKNKYAFIEFAKEFEVEEAILGRNGVHYKGQRLRVTKAKGVKQITTTKPTAGRE